MAALTKEQLIEKLGPFINEAAEAKFTELMKSTLPSIVKDAIAETTMKQDTEFQRAMISGGMPTKTIKAGSPEDKRGIKFAQVVRALASAKSESGGFDKTVEYLNAWGADDVAAEMTRAREKSMQAGAPTAGGFLVPETFSQEIVEYLRPMSVVREANPMVMPMLTGTLRIPRVDEGSTATYIGESVDVPKTELVTGQVTLTWKKLAALVPLSNDLLRYSAPSADAVVRDDVARAMAQAENAAFLRGRGTDASPKGLRYWCDPNNIFEANQTVNNPNVNNDLGDMILRLKENNIPMTRPCWIMAPKIEVYLMTLQNTNGFYVFRDEMMRGVLWNIPYKTTTEMPVNLTVNSTSNTSEIFLVDFADAIIGEAMTMRVDVSTEATYLEGNQLKSSFSRDETTVRVIAEHDFAMRRNNSIAVMNRVGWGN